MLKKLYLVQNSLKDPGTATIIDSLSQTEGITGLGIIGNGLGPASYESIAKNLVPSRGFQKIRKLVLKDPNPLKIAPKGLQQIFYKIIHHSEQINNLRHLCLSHLGFDAKSLRTLGQAVGSIHLTSLDISSNALQSSHLVNFLIQV